MKVLLVHPSALMYSEIYLRLEPLGMERVAAALKADGHDVRILDLKTQSILNRKHLGVAAVRKVSATVGKLLLQRQTNFVKMLWKFNKVYNPQRQYEDHFREVRYQMKPPAFHRNGTPRQRDLYVHNADQKPAAHPALATSASGDR